MKKILALCLVFILCVGGVILLMMYSDPAKKLATPELSVAGVTVTWAKIENAKDYTVSINSTETIQTALTYSFADCSPDNYVIKVRANTGDTKKFKNSSTVHNVLLRAPNTVCVNTT